MAYANGSRSRQDSSTGELRTSRIEQPSEDTGLSNQTERGEVKGWWHTDPAEVAYASEQGLQGHDQQQAKQTEASHGRGSEEHTDALREGWTGAEGRSCEPTEGQSCGHFAELCKSGSETETGSVEPIVGRVAHGVANRVDRLKAIGNGQVPGVAAIAFVILSEGFI